MFPNMFNRCLFAATFTGLAATATMAFGVPSSDPTAGLNGFPAVLHCDSSYSPIRSASGTKVKVQVSANPLAVVAIDAAGKTLKSFKVDQINNRKLSSPSFDCKPSLRSSPAFFQAKVACLTMTVPEPNRFSFIGEISVGASAVGAPFEGQLMTGTSDRPLDAALYLWNCVPGQ